MYWICHKNNQTTENALKYKIPGAVFADSAMLLKTIRMRLQYDKEQKLHRYFIFKCISSNLIVFMTYPIQLLLSIISV